MKGVCDGETFPQELRIPGKLDRRPGGRGRREPLRESGRRPGRYSGFSDDEAWTAEQRGKVVDGVEEIAEIRGVPVRPLRRPDAEEMNVAGLCDFLDIGGEA